MDWEERAIKKTIRSLLLDSLWFDRPISYLGLPSSLAIFERDLISMCEIKELVLIERNFFIVENLRKNIVSCDILSGVRTQVVQVDVDEWLLSLKSLGFNPTLDFAWLDYCGPITAQRLDVLEYLLRILPEDGILAATFLVGRELEDIRTVLSNSYGANTLSKASLPSSYLSRINLVTSRLRSSGINLDITVQPYSDNSPMLLFIVKKGKKVGPLFSPMTRTIINILPFLNSTNKPKISTGIRASKTVCIDDIEYESISAAARALDMNVGSVIHRLNSGKFPTFKYVR